eukprot:g7091.t1
MITRNASYTNTHQLRGITVWRLGDGLLASRSSNSYSPTLNAIYEVAKLGSIDFLKEALAKYRGEAQWLRMLEWEDSMGRTPLLIAVQRQHLASVELLLEAGANVDHISRESDGGNTALHAAFHLENCRQQMVKLLMTNGADPFLENHAGYTPWDICRQKKCRESEELAKQAILHGRFQVKDGNFLTPPRSLEGLELKLFAYYRLSTSGQYEKELSALRLLLYKRKIQKVVYDIDLMECDARIVSKTETTYLIHLTCPMHCIEEWKGSTGSSNWDGTFNELYIKGKKNCSEKFLEIIQECQDRNSMNEEEECLTSTSTNTPLDHHSNSDFDTSHQETVRQHILDQSSGMTDCLEQDLTKREIGETNHGRSQDGDEDDRRNDCTTAPSSTDHISVDSRCVICLEKQRTVGFVHGSSMHICVCHDCAQHFSRVVDRCPLCRQTIHHVVKQIFMY